MKFVEKERECELVFEANGPFWHVYTDGSVMADMFCCEEDFREGMVALAVCAVLFGEAELVTFELMNNHVHLVMRGTKEACLEFFEIYKRRLMRVFLRLGKAVDWSRFEASILQIETLTSLRNEILYAHRNAYVANRAYTPFGYRWGGGWAYFNPAAEMISVVGLCDMGARKMRELTHCRDVHGLVRLKFNGDVPYIPSFCRVEIGQAVFQDPRSYFHGLSKNVEAFSHIASRLKDRVVLTDDEMFAVAARWAMENFSTKVRILNPEQKIQLARMLHYDYNATNVQLRRILGLELAVLDEMFPPVR
ncbi:MAG: hypothetical protein IKY48_02790 [Bacteroidales bacterium]|nr:hypothetical protein [Bacteroidales bacterium]